MGLLYLLDAVRKAGLEDKTRIFQVLHLQILTAMTYLLTISSPGLHVRDVRRHHRSPAARRHGVRARYSICNVEGSCILAVSELQEGV